MNQPLISVVIPVWNEEKRIVRAINAMREQTYKNLEIIVVDDGSTDGTREACEALVREDPRVNYYYHHDSKEKRTDWRGYDINAGYAARNYGFARATGEWITTQDADDSSLLNRIEVQYALATRYHATLVTIQWQGLFPEWEHRKLDVDRIFTEQGEHAVVIRPEAIVDLARRNRGILMHESFHRWIPFPIKWFPYTRKLFFRRTDCYPGADNCMLFHRSVRDQGFYFRHRDQRTWSVPSGRGSGRDFAFRIALHFKNSWSFRLPMYLWDVKVKNEEYNEYTKYLI